MHDIYPFSSNWLDYRNKKEKQKLIVSRVLRFKSCGMLRVTSDKHPFGIHKPWNNSKEQKKKMMSKCTKSIWCLVIIFTKTKTTTNLQFKTAKIQIHFRGHWSRFVCTLYALRRSAIHFYGQCVKFVQIFWLWFDRRNEEIYKTTIKCPYVFSSGH